MQTDVTLAAVAGVALIATLPASILTIAGAVLTKRTNRIQNTTLKNIDKALDRLDEIEAKMSGENCALMGGNCHWEELED